MTTAAGGGRDAAGAHGAAAHPAPVAVHDAWVPHPRGRLYARRWRAGPHAPVDGPILLLHDSLGCVELWRDWPAVLARSTGRDVVAYDRLGFGRSAARHDRLAPGFVAEEAAHVLPVLREALGIGRFVALGHSVGGGMAVHAAAEAGEDCEALVTLAAQAFVEARTLEGIRAAQRQFEDPRQVERLARYHGERTAWVLQAWIGTWLDPAFASWSLDPVLPRVRCPVLAVHGALDEYGSPEHPRRIARLSGGPACAEVLDGVGHVPQREQPQGVASRIAAFLAATVSRPG